jgi:hypothetical protein
VYPSFQNFMQNAKFEVHRTIVCNAKVVEESEEVLLIKGIQKVHQGRRFFHLSSRSDKEVQ